MKKISFIFFRTIKYGFRKSDKLILVMQIVAASAARRSDSILVYVKDSKQYSRLILEAKKK